MTSLMTKPLLLLCIYPIVGSISLTTDLKDDQFPWILIVSSLCFLLSFIMMLALCQQCLNKFNFMMMEEDAEINKTNESAIKIEPLANMNVRLKHHVLMQDNFVLLKPKLAHVVRTSCPSRVIIEEQIDAKIKELMGKMTFILDIEMNTNTVKVGNTQYGKIFKIKTGEGKTSPAYILHETNVNSDLFEKYFFLSELLPLTQVQHSNVLKFFGLKPTDTEHNNNDYQSSHTENTSVDAAQSSCITAIMECCSNGDLKSFMRSQRPNYKVVDKQNLLVSFANDIATGLQALHNNKFVHRDLSLRNCLLTKDLIVKIGDYATSEINYPEDYFRDQSGILIPIRWLAPEVLSYRDEMVILYEINMDSNLWTFGIILWELVTFGAMPYNELSNLNVLKTVIVEKKCTMGLPDVPITNVDKIYDIMSLCWKEPELRRSMKEIRLLLLHLLREQKDDAEYETTWNQLLNKNLNSGVFDNSGISSFPNTFDHSRKDILSQSFSTGLRPFQDESLEQISLSRSWNGASFDSTIESFDVLNSSLGGSNKQLENLNNFSGNNNKQSIDFGESFENNNMHFTNLNKSFGESFSDLSKTYANGDLNDSSFLNLNPKINIWSKFSQNDQDSVNIGNVGIKKKNSRHADSKSSHLNYNHNNTTINTPHHLLNSEPPREDKEIKFNASAWPSVGLNNDNIQVNDTLANMSGINVSKNTFDDDYKVDLKYNDSLDAVVVSVLE